MDIRVVKVTDILRIDSFEITKLATPSIVIVGVDIFKVDYVKINNVKSPGVIVLNKSKALVQLPESEIGKTLDISMIEAYSYDAGNTRRNTKIELGLGSFVGKTSNQSYLVQKFVKLLMTKTGSNTFKQDEGSDFTGIVGSQFPADPSIVKAVVTRSIRSVESYILENQQTVTNPSSRLSTIQIKSVVWNKDEQSLSVSVSLIDETGNSTELTTGG